MAIAIAAATGLVIVVNAAFLQSGSHPAPFFATPTRTPPSVEIRSGVTGTTAKPPELPVPTRPVGVVRTAPVAMRHSDPIAELIGSSVGSPSRVMAVQRALTEFGYGQIKPSGVLDPATSAAIERFEREHNLPVTGRLSDRLLSGLAALVGHPLD